MAINTRDLGGGGPPIVGSYSPDQNRSILIVALTCSSISLLATLLTLRWFVLMNRLFRHRLVLFLIASDTIKALFYFISPVVVFVRGDINSSSHWCQASGFFLSLAIEASDFAILLIAVHAILYVFRPPIRFGEGGLYPYRRWLPLIWLLFPLLAASLAFVNRGNAYVTAGTYCYLPQRPFWYRLALSWIPRYLILIAILAMYAAISIYVRVKFRSFKNLEHSTSSSGIQSGRKLSFADPASPDSPGSPGSPGEKIGATNASTHNPDIPPLQLPWPQTFRTANASQAPNQEPWESINFITSAPLAGISQYNGGIDSADFARAPLSSNDTEHPPQPRNDDVLERRKTSEVPTVNTASTEDMTSSSQIDSTIDDPRDKIITDPLKRTRLAIRQQLRFLFIYPAVYILMWAFPFANHCLLYSDRLASHPIFWLQILSVCSLSLQAAANCAIFSTREKPWRRIDKESKFALPFWRRRGLSYVQALHNRSTSFQSQHDPEISTQRRTTTGTEATMVELQSPRQSRGADWWEAEGKKRKDSVWLGTDTATYVNSQESGPSSPRSGPGRIEEEREAEDESTT